MYWHTLRKLDDFPPTLHATAFLKYLSGLSFMDVDGKLMHASSDVPEITVMLISPTDGGGKVYERLGLGRVYLKRWVEAKPKFETIVLG